MGKIRIRHGENEIELEGSDSFIKKQLSEFYSNISLETTKPLAKIKEKIYEESSRKISEKKLTAAEYYKSKGKKDGISRLLIFAKYLEDYRGISEFTAANINQLAKEVKLQKDIHPQYFSNAVNAGFLRSLGRGKYSLTLSAEEILSSL